MDSLDSLSLDTTSSTASPGSDPGPLGNAASSPAADAWSQALDDAGLGTRSPGADNGWGSLAGNGDPALATPAPTTNPPSGQSSWLGTAGDFLKGVGEGAWDGAKGMVQGVGSLAQGAYGLATSADARQQAMNTAAQDAKAAGQFAQTAVTDPGKAASQVGNTVSGAWNQVSTAYQQAAAQGHGAEFIGKAFGQGAVLAGTALIPGGAEAEAAGLAGDAGRVAELAGDLGKAGEVGADAGKAADVATSASDTGRATNAATTANPGENGVSSAAATEAPKGETAAVGSNESRVTDATASQSKPVEAGNGSDTTKVYRVEGEGNKRVSIGEDGNVEIPKIRTNKGTGPERNLYLNFGDEARAQQFLQQRLQQFPDNVIKSFDVPTSFVDDLRANAVPEAERALNPTSPVIADPTKAADQFGLPSNWIERLRGVTIQGSGEIRPQQ